MYKQSLFFTLFRLLIWLAILGFMAMLYWSSLLVEENLKEVKHSLKAIGKHVNDLRSMPRATEKAVSENDELHTYKQRLHINPELPNLLTEDHFYVDTLPKLLGKDFVVQGTLRESYMGKPDNLHPFSGWAPVQEWIGLCSGSLARGHVGKYETFAPSMAIKVEGRPVEGSDSPEYWVHLREDVFWQPLDPKTLPSSIKLSDHFFKKHPVTSYDYKLLYDAVMNPFITEPQAISLRLFYSDIEEFRIVDDLTFVVRWKSYPVIDEDGKTKNLSRYLSKSVTLGLFPLASFLYKYFPDGRKIVEEDNSESYRTNSIWAQNFAVHWAKNVIPSCGAWIFDGITERMVRFRRNPDHFEPLDALVESLEIQFKESADTAWQAFKSGGIDFLKLLPDQLLEFKHFLASEAYQSRKSSSEVKHIEYVERLYSYIGWNELRPFFSSSKVRRALTMAVDRKRIINQNLNGLGIEITGTFFRYSPNYDTSIEPLPYDPEQAKRLLEEEGWFDTEGDGILRKTVDGKKIPFEFTIIYYTKNSLVKSVVENIITSLKEIGIRATPRGVDIADLSAIFDDKNFDAYQLSWTLGSPPEDPKQLWHSSGAKEKGSSNAIGFQNAEVDQIVDQLTYEYDPEKRLALYHRFDKILYEEMPYLFLYTPKFILAYRDYVQNVFIPAERQDLIPGANVAEPITSLFWIKKD